MAIKYLSGLRLTGTEAERVALETTSLTAIPQTSWKELARYTLTSNATSIRVGTGTQTGSGGGTGNFTAKDNLMVLMYFPNLGSGLSASPNLTFNDDEGSSSNNYANRRNFNGGTDSGGDSQDFIEDLWNSGQADTFVCANIRNVLNKEKLLISHSVTGGTSAGDTTTCESGEHNAKWVGTAQIVNLKMTTSGGYASGSEIIVLGMDDDEADSGTNFWQELTYKTLSANGTMQTDAFTAKKYLMADMFLRKPSATSTITTCFNDDFEDSSQTNYSTNNHEDGGTLDDRDNSKGIYAPEDNDDWNFFNLIIANPSGKEKLVYMHNQFSADGDGNQPHRTEYYGKWQTTSGQITRIGIHQHDAGSMTIDDDSVIRVWGAN